MTIAIRTPTILCTFNNLIITNKQEKINTHSGFIILVKNSRFKILGISWDTSFCKDYTNPTSGLWVISLEYRSPL